jgi:FKBP-type peptidyl-prolyl cis-trans isomerase
MARPLPGMRPTVAASRPDRWGPAAPFPWRGSFLALALAMLCAGRCGAQMTSDEWSTDPTMMALNPGQAFRLGAGEDFPMPTYGAIGSSLARSGHLVELGWNEAQASAFLEGMRAAFLGKPYPLDDRAQQLLSEIGRRAAAQRSAQPGPAQAKAVAPDPDFPLASCNAIGSFLAMTGHFAELGWNEAQTSAFLEGMRSALQGKALPFDESARRLLSDIGRQITDIQNLRKLDAPSSLDDAGRLAWYMKKVRNRMGLQQSDSGLAYRVEAGRGGVRPRPGDTIMFTCNATDANGTRKLPQMSGERIHMKMENLLPGLMEGLQMMTIDASAVFVLPPNLSFGNNPWPDGVQRGAPIIVTVTLYDVVAAGAPQ